MIEPINQVLKSPLLPKDGNDPVFSSPWEARAFGMTIKLYEAGKFEWTEWAEELTNQISLIEKDESSTPSTYYECWIRALEEIMLKKNLISKENLENIIAHTIAHPQHPNHNAQRKPIAYSPAQL